MSIAALPLIARRNLVIGTRFGPPKEKASGGMSGVDVALAIANPLWFIGKRAVQAALSDGSKLKSPPLFADANELDGLAFPPGHPQEGVLYIANPVRPNTYIVAANFHRVALAEKVGELFRLLTALRSSEVSINVVKGEAKSGGAFIGALIPVDVPVKIKAKAGATQSTHHDLSYSARFDGRGAPCVPSDLQWFEHEAEWRALAEARLRGDLAEFRLGMRYTDDFGVNASLKVGVESIGVSLGGEFQTFKAEEWLLSGTFKTKPLLGW
jgi:hypothetical protein